MYREEKYLNKTLANQIQQYIKRTRLYNQIPFTIDWFNREKSRNVNHNESHRNISTDTLKAYDKIQHPLILKTELSAK
jgi:hypothetical protein